MNCYLLGFFSLHLLSGGLKLLISSWVYHLHRIKMFQKQCVHFQKPHGSPGKNVNKAQTELKNIHNFFVYSISETYSLIFPVHLPLCSIYMFKALLPLQWSCSWEFCFLLQSSHITQLSNPVGRTDLSNLISFIWQICGKSKFKIWLYGAAFICIRQTTGFQSWQLSATFTFHFLDPPVWEASWFCLGWRLS